MSKRQGRNNRSKKKNNPSKKRRRQSSQADFRTSSYQPTRESLNGMNVQTTESQRFYTRLNRFLIQRKPRVGMAAYILLGMVGGGVIGVFSSFLVTTLHTDLDEPWPYLINGIVLLSLETIRSWLYFVLYPYVARYVKRTTFDLVGEQTDLTLPTSEKLEVKWDFGKDAKIVVVAAVGIATYLTTNPVDIIEPLQKWGFDNVYSITATIGAIGMLLRGLSNQQVIQTLLRGKPKYQIEYEAREQNRD